MKEAVASGIVDTISCRHLQITSAGYCGYLPLSDSFFHILRYLSFSRTSQRSCRDVYGAKVPSTAHVCDPPETILLFFLRIPLFSSLLLLPLLYHLIEHRMIDQCTEI